MTVLMALASVVAFSVFLTVVALGLLLIVKSLHSVRGYLEQIAMGVRAIETHAKGIPTGVGGLAEQLTPLRDDLVRAAERLDAAGRTLASRRGE